MASPKRQSARGLLALPLVCSPLLLLLLYPQVGDWTIFIGRFHPVVLHLPIGILFLTGLLELLQTLSLGRLSYPTRLPLLLGTMSAIAAMTLGILLMSGEAMEGELVDSHFNWGIATAVAATVALVLRLWPHFTTTPLIRHCYRASLLATCSIMIWASHQGASITHGEAYLTDYVPWRSDEQSESDKAIARALSLPLEERNVFEHLIVPILDSKCYECHQTRKFKGRLVMDTYEGLLKGGESGPSIVPGNIDESLSITRTHLPIDNEEHMPPSNKPQLTSEEQQLLEWWVESGAPNETLIATMDLDDELSLTIEMVSADLLAALNTAREEIHHELTPEQVAEMRASFAIEVAALQGTYPGLVRYQNNQSDAIVVSSFNHKWSDDEIADLSPIAAQVHELVLPRSHLTAASTPIINQMTQLEVLDLRSGQIKDDFIQILDLPNLKRLNLFQTQVSPESVEALSRHQTIETLYLSLSLMDIESVDELRKRMPHSEIVFESFSISQTK